GSPRQRARNAESIIGDKGQSLAGSAAAELAVIQVYRSLEFHGVRSDITHRREYVAGKFPLHCKVVRLEIAAFVILLAVHDRHVARIGENWVNAVVPLYRENLRK